MSTSGRYRIRAYIPASESSTELVDYWVNSCGISDLKREGLVEKSQLVPASGWLDLGEFTLKPGAYLELKGLQKGRMVADAVEFTRLP
jgi:hypothetical protein